jgi:hypothetical protein
MNEKELAKKKITQKLEIVRGILGLLLAMGIIGFVLFYNKTSMSDTGNKNASATETGDALDAKFKSKILEEHVTRINKIKNDPEFLNLKKDLDQVFLRQLEEEATLPKIDERPYDVREEYDTSLYGREYIKQFSKATTSGMGAEIVYFISQLGASDETMMQFAPSDVEKIYKSAIEYENFASNIQKIKTPSSYIDIATTTIHKSREIAFYLRKMMDTKDTFVYANLFSKYIEAYGYIFK